MTAAALPSARVLEFIRHLRLNGFSLGVAEAEAACTVLAAVPPGSGAARLRPVRLALRSLLAGNREEWQRFDELFNAWWLAGPRFSLLLRRSNARSSASSAVAASPRALPCKAPSCQASTRTMHRRVST